MAQTYGQTISVSQIVGNESEIANDTVTGKFLFIQNNTSYDCNLLVFKDPSMGSKPVEFVLRAGGSIEYVGELGAYAVYTSSTNSNVAGVKPAGSGGGYVGAGSAPQGNAYVGYLTVLAYDEPVPMSVGQSNYATVNAQLQGALPAGTNMIGHMIADKIAGQTTTTDAPVVVSQAPHATYQTPVTQTGTFSTSTTAVTTVNVTALAPVPAGKTFYLTDFHVFNTNSTQAVTAEVMAGGTSIYTGHAQSTAPINADIQTEPQAAAGVTVSIQFPATTAVANGSYFIAGYYQ